ncbi:transposase [Streptomyces hygroscopicus]|uniref:transposase n=1 Tax=Streptomyces hygroscopicus TaxID=1912 RepID=UPI0036423A61
MKHYPAEFKADAVALYRSRPGLTIKSVAEDLGVNTETLRNWIRAADGRRPGAHSTTRTAAPLTPDSRPATSRYIVFITDFGVVGSGSSSDLVTASALVGTAEACGMQMGAD